MSSPVLGLSTYREPARWGVWDTSADLLPADYARSIERAGGVAVLLPPAAVAGSATAVVARLDGLVITGGADLDPGRYGAAAHPRTSGWRADRDAWELALLDAAYAAGMPVLGICRGMQVMAVHAGGSIDQHVPDLVGHDEHSPGGPRYGSTAVEVVAGSLLHRLIGDRALAPCHHHQAVRTHPGFVPVAHAADGTVEAMEAAGPVFRLAVQWHPETAPDAGLFRGLVDACRERAQPAQARSTNSARSAD